MLHIKNLESISELQAIFQNHKNVQHLLSKFFQNFLVCKKIQDLKHFKIRGDSPVDILLVLLILPYIQFGTISGLLNSAYSNLVSSQKDVYYRFKNESRINWRSILYSINKRYDKIVENKKQKFGVPDSDEKRFTCLIGDDTIFQKTGKSIENVGLVHDHGTKRSVLGFKALVLGFFDGVSFRPLDFSLHREKGNNSKKPYGLRRKDLKKQHKNHRDSSSPSAKRVKELDINKIDVLIEMIKRAVKHGFVPNYVLVDSWFLCDKFIISIRKIRNGAIHIVAACRKDKRKYVFGDNEYSAKELLRKFKNNAKRSRSLRYQYIKIKVVYKGVDLFLFFNRAFYKKSWSLIVTTNGSLNFKKVMEIYSRRWTIEVFFKEVKQHLYGGKCQSNNFDAQICDFTVSCINYVILSMYKRFSSYETIGGVFEGTKALVIEQTVAERIWGMFLEIIRELIILFEIDAFELMQKITSDNEKGAKILKILNVLRCSAEKEDINIGNFNNAT